MVCVAARVRTARLRVPAGYRPYSAHDKHSHGEQAHQPIIPETVVPATSSTSLPPLSAESRAFLARLIRVDQAGELAADLIYSGQHAVLKRTMPSIEPLIKHMWEQEVHHHATFDHLQTRHRIRPSFLTPLWKVAAYGLGVGTAAMGKEAAMACTEAVETVIGAHYNNQLRTLAGMLEQEATVAGGHVSPELQKLAQTVSQFRDDELEHLDTAVQNDAAGARPYWLLTETIKGGCRAAVWVAERV
ncbi:ubiquinone biosynthesis protein COQ7-domain-containing protein [Limtongia smithiae]|uniref:ubiquinone biosynthesis protein COQ7-domain-containing protein n=1 Tax=Limtongia smithiae TaxID=1125753 RepID=UPI0034CFCFFC